jgi:hypothetical protein
MGAVSGRIGSVNHPGKAKKKSSCLLFHWLKACALTYLDLSSLHEHPKKQIYDEIVLYLGCFCNN